MYLKFFIPLLLSGILFMGCNDNPEPQGITKDCQLTGISSYIDNDLYETDTIIYTTDTLIKEIYSVYPEWQKTEDQKTSFIYDDLNRLKKTEFFDGAVKARYFDFIYGNNIIHRHRYISTNGIDFTLSYDSVQFFLDGATIQSFVSYNSGVVYAKESYEYDTKGNVKKLNVFNANGTLDENQTYTIEHKATGINPNYILEAGGLLFPDYSSLSPQIVTKVNGSQVDGTNEYNDDGYIFLTRYYSGAEPWTVKYRYTCKE